MRGGVPAPVAPRAAAGAAVCCGRHRPHSAPARTLGWPEPRQWGPSARGQRAAPRPPLSPPPLALRGGRSLRSTDPPWPRPGPAQLARSLQSHRRVSRARQSVPTRGAGAPGRLADSDWLLSPTPSPSPLLWPGASATPELGVVTPSVAATQGFCACFVPRVRGRPGVPRPADGTGRAGEGSARRRGGGLPSPLSSRRRFRPSGAALSRRWKPRTGGGRASAGAGRALGASQDARPGCTTRPGGRAPST